MPPLQRTSQVSSTAYCTRDPSQRRCPANRTGQAVVPSFLRVRARRDSRTYRQFGHRPQRLGGDAPKRPRWFSGSKSGLVVMSLRGTPRLAERQSSALTAAELRLLPLL